jgi:hypothetical protein
MPKIDFSLIASARNRGVLLDIVVFLVNVVLMTILSRSLADLINQAKTDFTAQLAMSLFCLGLVFLQPTGAILKRRRAHLRRPDIDHVPLGRLFLPACFLAQLLFLIAASGMIVEMVSGKNHGGQTADYFGLSRWLFTALFLGIPALAIANTFIVYFYFQPPKRKPLFRFLDSPPSELLGDACLLLNIIGYQAFWGLLMTDLPNDYSGIVGRLFAFGFAALLIYFPPRLFFLAEDGRRPLVWLTMLLANSPVILRIFFATGTKSMKW